MATQPSTAVATLPESAEAQRFGLMQRQARMFAMSPLVPEHLRKGPPEQAMANCYIAMTIADRMGEDRMTVMQNIHIVSGKAGFAAQYMIARANASGVFKGRIGWRIDKSDAQNLAVTAYATLADSGEQVEFTCDMAMATAEQWTKNPKYRTMPEVMLRYRSATFLVRFYAPDVMLGYHTADEVEDVILAARPASEPLTATMLVDQSRPASPDPEGIDQRPLSEVLDDGIPALEGDQQANDGTLSDENPTAAEGPADEDRGEPQQEADDLGPAARQANEFRERIAQATTKKALGIVEDFLKVRAVLHDDDAANLDRLINEKRKAFSAGQEG